MKAPKIELKYKIKPDPSTDNKLLLLVIYIANITLYDDITETSCNFKGFPLELFLYNKLNNTATKSSYEFLYDSNFVRVFNFTDLDPINPSLFGSEELHWADPLNPQVSLEGTLQPSVNLSYTPILSIDDCENVLAPLATGSSSGYYKSRVFIYRSESKEEILDKLAYIRTALSILIQKYLYAANTLTTTSISSLEYETL